VFQPVPTGGVPVTWRGGRTAEGADRARAWAGVAAGVGRQPLRRSRASAFQRDANRGADKGKAFPRNEIVWAGVAQRTLSACGAYSQRVTAK